MLTQNLLLYKFSGKNDYDAFGNALGNSIVSGIQTSTTKKNVAKALEKVVAKAEAQGATSLDQQQAVEEALSHLPPAERKRVQYSQDGDFLNISIDGQLGGVGINTAVSDITSLRTQHNALLDFMSSNSLLGNRNLTQMSMRHYDARSNYQSMANITKRADIAYNEGIVSGIHNYNAGQAYRQATMTGFDGNFTDAEWLATINNKTMGAWRSDLTSDVMTVMGVAASAPFVLAGAVGVGAWGARGVASGGRAFGAFVQHGSQVGFGQAARNYAVTNVSRLTAFGSEASLAALDFVAPGAGLALPVGRGLNVAYRNMDELQDISWGLERGTPQSYGEIRQWYNDVVGQVPDLNKQWLQEGFGLESRAKMAFDVRHGARVDAREFMIEPFDVTNLQIRDTVVHGNPHGPTFESLYQKYSNEGLIGNEIYERILSGSNKTNSSYNSKFGVIKR